MKKCVMLGVVGLAANVAAADLTIGGYTFADNAFIDEFLGSEGNWVFNGVDLPSSLTDINPETYAFSTGVTAFVDLRFTDNLAYNLDGADLVIFEQGIADFVDVTINGVRMTYQTVDTGETVGGFALNAAAIDLSDFGIAVGATITDLRIWGGTVSSENTVATYSLIGALHVVPTPGALAMLALSGVMAGRRRR